MSQRLGLGTAQFGMPYGISRNDRALDNIGINKILECAWHHGINTLDTAISYGTSEQKLGQIGVQDWQVITKLPAVPDQSVDIGVWSHSLVVDSCNKLKRLLLHQPQQLMTSKGDDIYSALIDLKKYGLVEKIGISISNLDELDILCSRYSFDLIQTPFNILDRRLETTGWLDRLYQSNVEIHARSIFLQGLLLMDQRSRPKKFDRWQTLWLNWHSWLDENQLTAQEACLKFVLSYAQFHRVLVGIHCEQQLQEILNINTGSIFPKSTLISTDLDLINPSRWSEL